MVTVHDPSGSAKDLPRFSGKGQQLHSFDKPAAQRAISAFERSNTHMFEFAGLPPR